jgi:hypothetical protein
MAIRKPAPKPATKPAPKPAPKAPAESFSLAQLRASQERNRAANPKESLSLAQLRAAQEREMGIAMARNPNYDTAMAQQNYANLMRDQQARLAAQQGQFTQGRLMGAPTEQPNPNAGKPAYFQALEGELQKQFLDKNPQLKPKPGTAPNPQLMQENYAKFLQNQMSEVNKFNAANPQYAQDIRRPNPEFARQSEQKFLEGLLDYSKVSPSQINVLNQLKSSYLNEGQGRATQPQVPQNQQMQNYNNLLQQGIQRSNTMNQGAMTDFANMQAGARTTQPAAPAKANPVVPIAGMGMQPKATPAPRKFSTVSNSPARFR